VLTQVMEVADGGGGGGRISTARGRLWRGAVRQGDTATERLTRRQSRGTTEHSPHRRGSDGDRGQVASIEITAMTQGGGGSWRKNRLTGHVLVQTRWNWWRRRMVVLAVMVVHGGSTSVLVAAPVVDWYSSAVHNCRHQRYLKTSHIHIITIRLRPVC